MKLAYPGSHEVTQLNDSLLALKIARHSRCRFCDTCRGLHPPPDSDVSLDNVPPQSPLGDLGQYGSDDEDTQLPYLDECGCGHGVMEHGVEDIGVGTEEFKRRGRVAIRLDELLQDVGKLLDFNYSDDDIASLRLQMRSPVSLVEPYANSSDQGLQSPVLSPISSVLSDVPPPNKKRRVSFSSASGADDDDDDDEEDRPLAARMAQKAGFRSEKTARAAPGHRSGKKGPAPSKTKASTAPTSFPPPTAADLNEMNGKTPVNGHGHKGPAPQGSPRKVKVEDKMDENQLSRLATGVSVDTGGRTSAAQPPKAEKMAAIELRKGVIQTTAVENDAQPRSLVILTGLKTLFQKQLPKMPREYIARLVYDSNSKSLAIIKRGYKVVGGICYRPFPHRGFAEIVFFATASIDQVKGYGAMLMDHFKTHIRRTYPNMMHFLTYADNYAVGYFEKQGFSKEITLDRSVWAGYIKDYEGGTIMQCTMLRKVDYLDKANIIARQQEAILIKIRQMSKSHIVYSGLPQFQEGGDPNLTLDPQDVPGLRESGWSPTMSINPIRAMSKNADHRFMERLLRDLQDHPQAWAFLLPVNGEDVLDYYDFIKNPMDFQTMEHKLQNNQYNSVDEFVADAQLVFDNCRAYNEEGSIYTKNATKLEGFLKEQLAERIKRED